MSAIAKEQELLMRVRVEAADAVRQMEAVSGQVKNFSREAANAGGAFGGMQRQVQQASYQITDFIVQVGGGQSALKAFGQQAPQLLAGFGAIGAAVGLVSAGLSILLESSDMFLSASGQIKRANEATTKSMELLKESTYGLSDGTVGAVNNWAKAWAKASADVRKDLEQTLNLTIQVTKAELELLKGRQDIDRAIAKGTTKENWYGGLSADTASVKDRQQAMENLNRVQSLQASLDAMTNRAANPSAPLLKTEAEREKDAKAGQKILDDYAKSMATLKAKHDELTISSQNLTQSQDDFLAVFNKITDSEKAKLKLDQEIAANVNKYSKSQQEALYRQLEENIAIEKSNVLKAEANKITVESDLPLDAYSRRMAQLNYLREQGAISQENFNQSMLKAKDNLANSTPIISGFGNAMTTAFNNMAFAGNSLSETFGNLVKDLARVAYQVMVTEPLVRSLKQTMAGMPFFAGNKYSGGADGYTMPNGESVGSANGNAFDAPISSGVSNVIPFAKGGVFSTPTYFPMAGGKTGLAFEAGPEAIMPLKRGKDGKLGVSTEGVGAGGTVVNVYNQNGGEVETKSRQDGNGNNVIDIYIKKAVADGIANGNFDKAFGSTYGLRRQGAR